MAHTASARAVPHPAVMVTESAPRRIDPGAVRPSRPTLAPKPSTPVPPGSPVTEGLPSRPYFTFLVFTDCAMTVVFVRALVVMVHLPFDRRMVHW